MSDEVKLSIFQKISAVMRDVEYLSKDDKVEFNNTKYKAISEEKVTATVRASLIKHGLIVIPVEQIHTKAGNLSTVDVKYKIIDIDTGDFEIIVSSGTGADTQDKGVGKAMTYSYKYLFLRTFAIPTGEDPDKVSSAELDDKQQKREEEAKKPPVALRAKWKMLNGGRIYGFDDWVVKQTKKGWSYSDMERALLTRLDEKKAEEEAANG
ncbi:ERF family protein [Paenibacillus sp. P2(2022)]|uniref:ERF family protein n=1 Tax=Paenibacillus sp. P2(2022) TaxID=2917813 RepID=UPI002405231E|nr:ERF family protein [Paenibacillus sp. P2(2022)]MDG0056946.1 ERF family protein [Paenibacillus sp. P2(2022)]